MRQREVVLFLVHIVSGEGVKPIPTNITKIMSLPKPKTAKQVKQLVATGSYYRRYVKYFANMVRPIVEQRKVGNFFGQHYVTKRSNRWKRHAKCRCNGVLIKWWGNIYPWCWCFWRRKRWNIAPISGRSHMPVGRWIKQNVITALLRRNF